MNDDPASTKLQRTVAFSDELELEIDGQLDAKELDGTALQGVERYAITHLIGTGGMGVVFRARDTDFDRDVALKVLLKSHLGNQEMHRRFFDEAQVTGQLEHPGIVPVYEMGASSLGRPYFAMKLVEGKTLAELLVDDKGAPLEQSRALTIFAAACQAMAYAHSRGVIHLDLKPSNLMVGTYGEIHVMDWGLSRRIDNLQMMVPPVPHDDLTNTSDSSSKITGTPAYMPPEQARGRSIGLHSDVFGLGAVLCEILTGQAAFVGKNVGQIYRRAVNASLQKTYDRLDACDADLSMITLAKQCLSSKPADRPPNAGIIAQQVTNFLESSMERAERDLCLFFELSTDLFCVASLEGYFKHVNSNFPRVLGYSISELVSRPFLDFVHPDDLESTKQAMAALMNGQPIAEFRNRYRHAEGQFVWFEWKAKPIPDEHVVFAVARDITLQVQQEQAGS